MHQVTISQRRSLAALGDAAAEWDELWRRSATRSPQARPGLIVQWANRFSPRATVRGLEVRRNGKLVAALPLIERRCAKLFSLGGLPANEWASCGELLLDLHCDHEAVLGGLIQAIDLLPWPIIQLAPVALEAPWWQAFRIACLRHGLEMRSNVAESVGQVEINGDWQAYRSRWSKNHRRHIEKAARRAQRAGRLTLETHTDFEPGDIERLMRLGFAVEDRSWKGEVGTSVFRTPGMLDFFLEQARRLADWRQLQLTFLRHDNRPIAFEYGYRGKGTYFSHKVGYDSDYAHFSPGQLLRALLLERFHQQSEVSLVDFCGPLTEATAKWSTRCYRIGKWLIAPRRVLSRCALRGHAVFHGLLECARQVTGGPKPHPVLPALRDAEILNEAVSC